MICLWKVVFLNENNNTMTMEVSAASELEAKQRTFSKVERYVEMAGGAQDLKRLLKPKEFVLVKPMVPH